MTTTFKDIISKGLLIIISAPSGAGKTSLTKELLASDKTLKLSISATTRPKRPGEIEGQDYFFITENEFKTREQRGEFLESAFVFGNYYGSPKVWVENELKQHHDLVFDIDWQGARILEKSTTHHLIKIFILPPSKIALLTRLRARGQDSEEVIMRRMNKAVAEISHYNEYNYVIINDDFNTALEDIKTIIRAERKKLANQDNLHDFVKDDLLKE